MKLLIIILKQEHLLDQISSILLEVGLFGSTVLDGENIETLADSPMPLFSSFKSLFGENYSYNRTIVSPVEDNESILDFLHICAHEGIDFSDPDTGVLLTVPCRIFTGENSNEL